MPRAQLLWVTAILAIARPTAATTVLAVRASDRAVLSADSRVQVVRGRQRSLDTGCKVHQSGGIVWSHAGYYANPNTGFDVVALADRVLAGGGTFDARLQRLGNAVSEPLQRALLALRKADPDEYEQDIGSPLKIVAIGMDGGAPVLAALQFERSPDGHLTDKLHRCPGDCTGGMEYVSAGSHREADRIVREDPGYFEQRGWRNGLRGLLDAEAAPHPDQVSAPYTTVEIGTFGIRWLDRGLCEASRL
ncbi:MAG: hypothetical protein LAP40_20880 [Acidobacteriia bacterium]|nr:hypothetical protein [Terriglobia bacterium]